MPVKPSTPATIEISRKISAHFRIVIANSDLRARLTALNLYVDPNYAARNWFLTRCAGDARHKLRLLNPVPGGTVRPGQERNRGGYDHDVTFRGDRCRGACRAEGQGAQ